MCTFTQTSTPIFISETDLFPEKLFSVSRSHVRSDRISECFNPFSKTLAIKRSAPSPFIKRNTCNCFNSTRKHQKAIHDLSTFLTLKSGRRTAIFGRESRQAYATDSSSFALASDGGELGNRSHLAAHGLRSFSSDVSKK